MSPTALNHAPKTPWNRSRDTWSLSRLQFLLVLRHVALSEATRLPHSEPCQNFVKTLSRSTPKLNTSAFKRSMPALVLPSTNISGALYSVVPRFLQLVKETTFSTSASPKSMSLMSISCNGVHKTLQFCCKLHMMFPSLRSRCATSRSCKYRITLATGSTNSITYRDLSSNPACFTLSISFWRSRSILSSTIKGMRLTYQNPMNLTRCGFRYFSRSSASFLNAHGSDSERLGVEFGFGIFTA